MKNIIFIWIAIFIVFAFFLVPLFVDFPVPFEGAVFLLGASISGYTGIKSLGVYLTAKKLPSGEGVSQSTKDKLTHVLIALYVIIIESIIVQYVKPGIELPLDQLFTWAGICSAISLGGGQAIKSAERQGE